MTIEIDVFGLIGTFHVRGYSIVEGVHLSHGYITRNGIVKMTNVTYPTELLSIIH